MATAKGSSSETIRADLTSGIRGRRAPFRAFVDLISPRTLIINRGRQDIALRKRLSLYRVSASRVFVRLVNYPMTDDRYFNSFSKIHLSFFFIVRVDSSELFLANRFARGCCGVIGGEIGTLNISKFNFENERCLRMNISGITRATIEILTKKREILILELPILLEKTGLRIFLSAISRNSYRLISRQNCN